MWEQMTRGDLVHENYEQFLTARPSILAADYKSLYATKVPTIQKVKKTVEILQVQFIDKVKSQGSCRAKTSAEDPEGTETRGSSQTELWTFQSC